MSSTALPVVARSGERVSAANISAWARLPARPYELFKCGLSKMRERGELRPEADPAALAHLLTAAFQGGALLDQAAGDSTPLRDALYGALAYVESFAADR
ncbi:hypothetical protein [Streptomyces sp. 142MFCol3.1]|uniref:hypothetical protein n=1 Tax=Streptomyces sp. 142MFCol3.1 TaxID=1172179 RepID=UPI0018F886DE|nr:hypothetical protein [Streptomyces sp. 142MFCol3.1]